MIEPLWPPALILTLTLQVCALCALCGGVELLSQQVISRMRGLNLDGQNLCGPGSEMYLVKGSSNRKSRLAWLFHTNMASLKGP